MRTRYFEATGRARKVTPRMMEYLAHVIDTPIDGRGLHAEIGRKMGVTNTRVGHYRDAFARKFSKEEIVELCEEIMKEAA